MRPVSLVVAALISTAIPAVAEQDIAITVCEAALKARLKAPSSYRQIEATITGNLVTLTYDAVNSFNAPLRAVKKCTFDYKDLHFTLGLQVGSLEFDAHMKDARKALKSKYGAFDAERHLESARKETDSWMADFVEGVAAAKTVEGYPIHISRTKLMPGN